MPEQINNPRGRVPKVGQAVRWPRETRHEIWTVKSIDTTKAEATLVQEGKSRLAPLSEIEPIGGHARTSPKIEIPDVEEDLRRLRSRRMQAPRERVRFADLERERNVHAPAKPRRLVDELVDHLEFSVSCLQRYKRRFLGWRRASFAEVEEELRHELRRGDFIRATRAKRYGQIETKRLAIHLERQPSKEDPLMIMAPYAIPGHRREAA